MAHGPKLLIIDGNGMFRRTLRDIVQRRLPDLRIFEAGDAQTGLRLAVEQGPGWIVSDMHLEGGTSLA